jgi:hypothetical protein
MTKAASIRVLSVGMIVSAVAACSTPPAGVASTQSAGWVDATAVSNIDDRGQTLVSNAIRGWSR